MSPKAKSLLSKVLIKEPKGEPDPQNSQNNQPTTQISPTPSEEKLEIKYETSSVEGCGICLSDDGKSIRGYINSCDHSFCYTCIREWAKQVESRCPLCTRPFSAIGRKRKDDVLKTEPIVSVPAPVPVYQHYENVATGHQDLYAEKQCTVCDNNSNESLLLLCNLCDSASHTYCVGLGDSVPEDDWICRDCTQIKYKHAEDDKDHVADCLSVIEPNSESQNRLQIHQNVSVADIVREPSFYNVERSSSNRTWSPSTHVRDDGTSIATAEVNRKFQAECHAAHSGSQIAARTVQYCRNVDSRIRALRQNWDKIRQGSLSFSSFPISGPGQVEVSSGTPCKLNSSSCSNQQAPPKRSSSNTVPDHATQDIRKAWKMMNNAISIEKKCTNNIVPGSSKGLKRPLSDTKTPKESPGGRSVLLSSSQGGTKDRDFIKFKEHYQDRTAEKHNDRRCSTPYSVDSSKLSTSKTAKYSVQDGIHHETCVNLPPNNSLGTFLNDSNKNHGASACRTAGPVAENRYPAKQNVHASNSSCNLDKVTNVEKHYVDGIDSTDAKSEIQSLVKINLKLLSTKKKLDTNAFKEVARLATHSILAACGIGPPKPWIRPFQIPNCSHSDTVEQVRRSSLMPSSCRECFFVFVKDVVNTIMLEKTS